MNDVWKDVIGKFVIVYLDDIVVFSKDQAEHCKHLERVLQPSANLSSLSCTFWATLWVPKGCA